MAELGEECLGLTSVGRDGECTDLVTGTEKPDLYLKKGDLFATARGMLTPVSYTHLDVYKRQAPPPPG